MASTAVQDGNAAYVAHKHDLYWGKVTQHGAHANILADIALGLIAYMSHKQMPGLPCQLLSNQSMHQWYAHDVSI